MFTPKMTPAKRRAPLRATFDAPAVLGVAVVVEEVALALEALVALLVAVAEAGPSQCLLS